MSSSLRCAWLLCTSLLLLSFSLPFEADAQPWKDRHRIRVVPEGESCVYEIQNQANQDEVDKKQLTLPLRNWIKC